jgi:hypothetical protein
VIAAVAIAAATGLLVAVAAAAVSRMGLRGDARLCLAAHLCAMAVRALGLLLIAVAARLAAAEALIPALGTAAGVVLIGLALDVRIQLRTLRAHTAVEDPARA